MNKTTRFNPVIVFLLMEIGMLFMSFSYYKVEKKVITKENECIAEVIECKQVRDRGLSYAVVYEIKSGNGKGNFVREKGYERPVPVGTEIEVCYSLDYPHMIMTSQRLETNRILYKITLLLGILCLFILLYPFLSPIIKTKDR